MPRIGPLGLPELLIILVVVLLVFGPRRLPDLAKGLGQSIREFRKGLRDMRKDLDDEDTVADASKNAVSTPAAGGVSSAVTGSAAQSSTAPQSTTDGQQ